MISKNQVKLIKSLSVKKYRDHEQLFIAEGDKIVRELLHSGIKIHSLYFTEAWAEELKKNKISFNYFQVSEKDLEKISLLENPNKVLAVAHIPSIKLELSPLKNSFTLILDNIQDPGNLGTIIRTADWFGIKNIICSPATADAYNPKVVQSAMGSLLRTKIFYEDLEQVLEQINKELKLPIYGATLGGESIYKLKLNPESILIVGNESKGISPDLLKFVNHKITIPKQDSLAESLNAAIATSIICSEFYRSSI
jgi:TrmH family RNA methyltransferase